MMIKKHLKFTNLVAILTVIIIVLLAVLNADKALGGVGDVKTYGSNVPRAKSNWKGPSYSADINPCLNTNELGLTAPVYMNPFPCNSMTFYPTYLVEPPGGAILTQGLENWWKKKKATGLSEILQKVTQSNHSAKLLQTQLLGTSVDATAINNAAKKRQMREVEARKRNRPSEYACIAGSNVTGLSKATSASEAIAQGFKNDFEKRAANATGTSSETGQNADTKALWDTYCAEFQDPDANNGATGCADAASTDGVKNGDISIETVLLKDTLDFSNEHERKAATALLQNLVQPTIKPQVVKASTGTSSSRENILKEQHIEAVRNLATGVISEIISRRSTSPSPDENTFIKDIRKKAGIPEDQISDNPSYNEMMLTLTKERFYDPGYFIKVQSSTAALKQEQTSVASYINIQLNDIYKLQEQINALLAARAAMKFNNDAKSSQVGASTIQ